MLSSTFSKHGVTQYGWALFFFEKSFKRNPTMWNITRLQLCVISECFLASKFCKGFLDFTSIAVLSWAYECYLQLFSLFGSSFVHQSQDTRVKCWKNVSKRYLLWALKYPLHIRGGERSFPYGLAIFWLDCKLFSGKLPALADG